MLSAVTVRRSSGVWARSPTRGNRCPRRGRLAHGGGQLVVDGDLRTGHRRRLADPVFPARLDSRRSSSIAAVPGVEILFIGARNLDQSLSVAANHQVVVEARERAWALRASMA